MIDRIVELYWGLEEDLSRKMMKAFQNEADTFNLVIV